MENAMDIWRLANKTYTKFFLQVQALHIFHANTSTHIQRGKRIHLALQFSEKIAISVLFYLIWKADF